MILQLEINRACQLLYADHFDFFPSVVAVQPVQQRVRHQKHWSSDECCQPQCPPLPSWPWWVYWSSRAQLLSRSCSMNSMLSDFSTARIWSRTTHTARCILSAECPLKKPVKKLTLFANAVCGQSQTKASTGHKCPPTGQFLAHLNEAQTAGGVLSLFLRKIRLNRSYDAFHCQEQQLPLLTVGAKPCSVLRDSP